MKASAHLIVDLDRDGRSRVALARAEAPLLLRETRSQHGARGIGAVEVHVVGGAAAPLGGDELDLRIDVGAGSATIIRSVAASLSQPSAIDAPSDAAVTAIVGEHASLDWWPEPLVSVRGSRHRMTTRVELAESATVRWVDEVCLGRAGEPSGTLAVAQRIRVGGAPVAVHDLRFGPDVASTGIHGPARVAITGIVHGPDALPSASLLLDGVRAARFPIGARTTAWTAVGDVHERVRQVLAELGLDRSVALLAAVVA